MSAFFIGYISGALVGVLLKMLGMLSDVQWWQVTLPLWGLGVAIGVWLVVRRVREEWWDIRRESQIEDRRREQ